MGELSGEEMWILPFPAVKSPPWHMKLRLVNFAFKTSDTGMTLTP